mgnify:CR=1 FL=1
MPVLYTTAQDGYVYASSTSSFAAARDATTGAANPLGSRYAYSVRASRAFSRGTTTWTFVRSFFEFDTSDIHVMPSVAQLSIYGFAFVTADMFVVKSRQGASLGNEDFAAIDGWVAGADNSSNVTKYSDEITTWSNSGYNAIILNSRARADMAAVDRFTLCCIEADYDLVNNVPGADFSAVSASDFIPLST